MDTESVDWLVREDERILELLRSDDVFTPDHIADEIDHLRSPDVAYRCRELETHGLVTKHAIGMYDISERGEQVLDGTVDPNELDGDADSS